MSYESCAEGCGHVNRMSHCGDRGKRVAVMLNLAALWMSVLWGLTHQYCSFQRVPMLNWPNTKWFAGFNLAGDFHSHVHTDDSCSTKR